MGWRKLVRKYDSYGKYPAAEVLILHFKEFAFILGL